MKKKKKCMENTVSGLDVCDSCDHRNDCKDLPVVEWVKSMHENKMFDTGEMKIASVELSKEEFFFLNQLLLFTVEIIDQSGEKETKQSKIVINLRDRLARLWNLMQIVKTKGIIQISNE